MKQRRMAGRSENLLNYEDTTLKEHATWWKQTGMDHVKLVTSNPGLLGVCSVEELQAKLDFLGRVAGMSIEDLNEAGPLLTYSLESRMRTRYFYALQRKQLDGLLRISTLMLVTDAGFLAMMQSRPRAQPAGKAEVARYQKLVTSAGFVAWRERQEARLLMRGAS